VFCFPLIWWQKRSDYFQQHSNIASFHSDSSWVVLSPIEQTIKSKIEARGVPLKDWDVKIYRGILTGYNPAFIINSETRDSLIAASPNSAEIIRPILRGRDIQKYVSNWQGLYIIGTFPSLNIDIDSYSAVKEHLLSFGYDRLKQTGEEGARKRTNNKWFEIQDSISYWEDFYKQKVVWKRIGSVLRFSYDQSGSFCLDSTCFATGTDIKFLVGYMNSKVSKRELLNNAPKTGTGDVITSVQALEPLKIPNASETDKMKIADLVDRCIKLLEKNPDHDISNIEIEIDNIIYDLFDFTESERLFYH
jgi:adenine-specific DNA-methyltransferase